MEHRLGGMKEGVVLPSILSKVFGDFRWLSRVLALLLSSTIRERFQRIARHLDRVHREHPD